MKIKLEEKAEETNMQCESGDFGKSFSLHWQFIVKHVKKKKEKKAVKILTFVCLS